MPLEDHANAVKRLAQTAFSQVTGREIKCLVYNAFFRSINDPYLQRYWLATKISSLEEVLEMGSDCVCPRCMELSSSPGQEEGW